jgi:streptomycin 6-kinase
VQGSVARWDLQVGDAFAGSHASLVLPATMRDGTNVVLKIQFPHRESEHEADALAAWNGRGAVDLLEEDREHHALLLERCFPGGHLSEEGDETALDVLTELLPRLWIPAVPSFGTLADEAAWWADELEEQFERAGRPFVRGWLDIALAALRDLPSSQGEQVLLHQDLHPDNVLRASREPWLAIDPKPLTGEREFSVAPIVRAYELDDRKGSVLRRLDRLTAELDLDRERACLWTIAQTLAWAFDGGGADPWHVQVVEWLAGSV